MFIRTAVLFVVIIIIIIYACGGFCCGFDTFSFFKGTLMSVSLLRKCFGDWNDYCFITFDFSETFFCALTDVRQKYFALRMRVKS